MKKTEDLKTLRARSLKELTKELALETEKLREHRFSLKLRKIKNTRLVYRTRIKIARIWTIIHEKLTKE